MVENFEVNLTNLSKEEKEQLIDLVKKSRTPKNKRWRAEFNRSYYTLYGDGSIQIENELNTEFDNNRYIFGNYFQNQEEVNFVREQCLVYQELKDYALEHDEKVNWNDDSYKYFLSYNEATETLFASYTQQIRQPHTVYFTFKENLHKAVEEIGEDKIKKYLFGIES